METASMMHEQSDVLCMKSFNRCGLTRDFYSDEFDRLNLPETVKAFGSVETTRVEIRDVYFKCAGMKKI